MKNGKHNDRRRRRSLRMILLGALSAGLLASSMQAANANIINISRSGKFGPWMGETNVNICNRDWYSGYIQLVSPYIGRSPNYPNNTQVLKLASRINYWNGSRWVFLWQSKWDSRTLKPGQNTALFSQPSVNLSTGWYYEVILFHEWWVNGTLVGTVTNKFDPGHYQGWGGTTVGQTGGSSSYCFI